MALREKGDLDGALQHLKPVAAANPDERRRPLRARTGAPAERRPAGAIAAFEKAIELEPEMREGYYALGHALKEQSAASRKTRAPAAGAASADWCRATPGGTRPRRSECRARSADEALRADDAQCRRAQPAWIHSRPAGRPARLALAHLERAIGAAAGLGGRALQPRRRALVQRRAEGGADRSSGRAPRSIPPAAPVTPSWARRSVNGGNLSTAPAPACSARSRCCRRRPPSTSISASPTCARRRSIKAARTARGRPEPSAAVVPGAGLGRRAIAGLRPRSPRIRIGRGAQRAGPDART